MRLAPGRAKATINRETEALRRAFSWGVEQQPPLVTHVPTIHRFAEDNARQGFLSRAEFEAVLGNIPDHDIRDFVEWGYWTGMRKGEAARLTWEMFDRETWTLRLHQSASKTGKGRVLVLAGPLRAIIERRLRHAVWIPRLSSTAEHREGQDSRSRTSGKRGHERAKPLGSSQAAEEGSPSTTHAGLPCANLIRAGVDQTVAMRISGHRTDSTFRRYNITSEDDLRDAVERVASYVDGLPSERKVVVMGESGPNADQKPPKAKSRFRR